jgi:dTDP-4-dehydrorhamnose reductase
MVPDQPRRILITGANGQLGFELQRSLSPLGEVIALDRRQCDLLNVDSITAAIDAHAPHCIVNAAAWTAVDLAESQAEKAFAVNAEAPAALARAAQARHALLVHYSSDYVFDGKKTTAYAEEDQPAPLSVYGASKLAGERAVAQGCERHLVFRTSWVFGAYGANFMKTVLRLAASRTQLSMVADQIGAPTSAALIADVTAQVLAAYLRTDAPQAFPYGLYHLAASGETSWYQYARFVVEQALRLQMPLTLGVDAIEPIPAQAYPLPAQRPQNSLLDTRKLQQAFGLVLPPWQTGVGHALRLIAS